MTNLDYGVLLEKFINILPAEDQHKSFIKKIINRTERYHKRHKTLAGHSELRVGRAVQRAEGFFKDNHQEISIGAVCWVIHNKHKEELSIYGFDKIWFEQMNRYYSAQGVIMTSARVVTVIEGFINE